MCRSVIPNFSVHLQRSYADVTRHQHNCVLCLYVRVLVDELSVIPPAIFPHGATAPSGPGPPRYRGFTVTLSWTPLD
jgi:hypothetical protein